MADGVARSVWPEEVASQGFVDDDDLHAPGRVVGLEIAAGGE